MRFIGRIVNGVIIVVISTVIGHVLYQHNDTESSNLTDNSVLNAKSTPSESLAMSVLKPDVVKQLKSSDLSYNQSGAFVINDNKTDLKVTDKTKPYVSLSEQDSLGRPRFAQAVLNQSTRQYKSRQDTGNAGTIDPVGWHQQVINKNQSLYNRGHLIGYALAGNVKSFDASEANPRNIITETMWANQAKSSSDTGQNYFEGLVRNKLDAGDTVIYKVAPVYHKQNLVPAGIHIEAESSDNQLHFNVMIPNVQSGVKINYMTGVATKGNM